MEEPDGGGQALTVLQRILDDIIPFCDGREIPVEILDSSVTSLKFCYREYLVLEVTSELGDYMNVGLVIY